MIYAVLKYINNDLEIYLFGTEAPRDSERFNIILDYYDKDRKNLIVVKLSDLKYAISQAEFRFGMDDGKAYR